MKKIILAVSAAALLCAFIAEAQKKTPMPQFQVDPFWPKALPNNWLLGQVASVAVGPDDHVWVLQRPRSLTDDEKGATLKPPRSKCCVPAPSVMEFDADGTFIQGWGHPTTTPWVVNEHGIHVDREALLAGREATVVVRAGLSLNGELASLSKLLEPRLVIQAVDMDGVPTREEIGGFKLFEDRESSHSIRVPRRLASLNITLRGKVKVASRGNETELSASQSFQVNGIQKTDRVDEVHLGRDGKGYWLEVAGRTGETRADRSVQVVLKHREFKEPVRVSLKSDAKGIVTLGPLAGIDRVEATVAGGAARSWA